jgi:retron-type reverse transcriptase
VEREGYGGAWSVDAREGEERGGAGGLLEGILDRDNLNRAYKRVRSNKGAPGMDGMTVEQALPWLQEHGEELLESLRNGQYRPNPVRRKEIPKPDGGAGKLGIPTVVDRVIQQAVAQRLQPIFEPRFSEGSYGYRPGRNGQQAMNKVAMYARQGYTLNSASKSTHTG